MSDQTVFRMVYFILLFGVSRWVAARDACENMVSDWRFDLELKSTTLTSDSGFVGVFEFSNLKYPHAVRLPGTRVGNSFQMDYPDVSVQFLDLNSRWASFTELAGSFLTPPDWLEIEPGSRRTVATPLMSPEIAGSSGSEFRIMVRLANPDLCVISRPFHALPQHSPATGFETSQ